MRRSIYPTLSICCAYLICSFFSANILLANATTFGLQPYQPSPLLSTDTLGPLNKFLTPAETFNKKRFWVSAGIATALYAGTSVVLYEAWYKNYDLGGFRTIDDRGEWLDMDKVGHGYTAYQYARWGYQGLRWSGTPKKKAILLAATASTVLQSTVEIMDGFSPQWGFSWYDVGMNASGTALFVGQQLLWDEQRLKLKISSFRSNNSTTPVPARQEGGPPSTVAFRAEQLYGTSPYQRLIKDYNAQTIWVSTNPATLIGRKSKLPWLNLAFGYSVDNVYGAFGNVWSNNGFSYNAQRSHPRQREFVLSLDVDFEKIPTKSPVLNTMLHLLNHFKFPAPALVRSQFGGTQWRWLYY